MASGHGNPTRLSRVCGVARQTVYNWRDGAATPTLDNVEIIDRVSEGAVARDLWFE
jgi:predicted transcriptional regulator